MARSLHKLLLNNCNSARHTCVFVIDVNVHHTMKLLMIRATPRTCFDVKNSFLISKAFFDVKSLFDVKNKFLDVKKTFFMLKKIMCRVSSVLANSAQSRLQLCLVGLRET